MSIQDLFSLEGRVAVVTGAGKGIGRAIALAYAEAGARVVVAARTAAEVQAVAREAEELGSQALALCCDVNDEAQRAQLLQSAMESFGRLDILVNNAGGGGMNDPLSMSAAEFDAMLHFNVTSTLRLSALAVPLMRAGGGGSILNIASSAARYAQKNFCGYGTAKAAVVQLTRLLAQDFAPQVRVNAIAPGPVLTEALRGFLEQPLLEQMAARTPLQCLGQTQDIAAGALYLASPAARWVTGKILEIDGGAESSPMPF